MSSLLWPAVALVILGAPAERRPIAMVCRDEVARCSETCTIEYGSSTKKRQALEKCLDQCDAERDNCADRERVMNPSP